ncbi:MAG: hypothetical protein ACWA49_01570 [Ruegeria sp.]
MKTRARLIVGTAALLALLIGAEADRLAVGGHAGQAEARVGRPLTPISVAGAGRRTVRRCAAGIYNC